MRQPARQGASVSCMGEELDVQIDLATVPAMLEHPTRVFVREATLCGAQTVADVIAPWSSRPAGLSHPCNMGFPAPGLGETSRTVPYRTWLRNGSRATMRRFSHSAASSTNRRCARTTSRC